MRKKNEELEREDLVGAEIFSQLRRRTIGTVISAAKYWRDGSWDIEFIDLDGEHWYWKQSIDGGDITKEVKMTEEEWQAIQESLEHASEHHVDCQCNMCVYGTDEWLRIYHPSEY